MRRDYLLPLPNPDFSGGLRHRAVYSDAVGFSRKLLGMLPDVGDNASPLLASDEAIGFWSEHSDRCGLDSWCAALNFRPSQRNFLGRWGAKGSSDKYVRTALRIIETLQGVAARAARAIHRGGPDYSGEEQTLYGLKVMLREKGIR